MANKYFATIKLDPPESYSTGGTVVDIQVVGEINDFIGHEDAWPIPEGCIRKEVSSDVQVGWIMQDKTGLIIDSNKK